MVISAADRFTIEQAKAKTWADVLTSFDKNPTTGYLAMVQNEESVKQAVRNLILTERTERFYRAGTGSKINSLLFEPQTPIIGMAIENEIRNTIKNSEPRVVLRSVHVESQPDMNSYFVHVVFSVVNIPDDVQEMSLILRRIR